MLVRALKEVLYDISMAAIEDRRDIQRPQKHGGKVNGSNF